MPAVVDRFCAQCHTGADAEAGFEIATLFSASAASRQSQSGVERAATALQRIRSRTMPPEDGDQPSDAQRFELAATVAALQPEDAAARIATLRRLTRTEYERTIEDLTGIAWDAKDLLPEDARAYGFDNVGDVMTVSPLLFEKYFEAAAAIATSMLATPMARERVFAADRPLAVTLPAFLERAFRRPVTADEVAERCELFTGLVQSGVDAELARLAVLRSIFASPAFLFRFEHGAPEVPRALSGPRALSNHELAVRLSYLITSSMPDEPLFELARSGRLTEPAVLVAQARRLVAASNGRALADNFAAQWLRFRDVLTTAADFRNYPQIWNTKLRPAFYQEAAHFFAALVRDDGSILSLLDADHTYLNATLAKHYGLAEVKGEQFRRVTLPDRRRGGLLGMGAMLMVASYPLRTSPVLRGRWILDQLLDASTPPPPANAGVLPADSPQAGVASLRERLELHRGDRACASCHAQIDPLGFALENYDVLGVWRTEVHGKPVDTHAMLPDGTKLDGPVALKDALLSRKADFVRAMAKKLLVYAIGRPMVAADEPEIARIGVAVAAGEYRFSALLAAVVTSPLFTMRDPGGVR